VVQSSVASEAAGGGESRGAFSALRDVVALAKPRLSALVLFTTAGGIYLAPGRIEGWKAALTLVMTTLAVAAANTLNCWLERDSDALMKRTRARPLPSGRLDHRVALAVGVVEAAISVPSLVVFVNAWAGFFAAAAIVSYVAIYTPLKSRSPWALYVGAIPGAIPPILGWCAVTGVPDAGGWLLFAVMFVWQVPHFLAIALYLMEDYRRAGIKVFPLVTGEAAARAHIVASTLVLVPVTFFVGQMRLAGKGYTLAALVLGLVFFGWAATGLDGRHGAKWARGLMLASVAYLTLLFIALGVDAG